jgi:hypothetical protein
MCRPAAASSARGTRTAAHGASRSSPPEWRDGRADPADGRTAIAVALLYTAAFISIPVVSGIEYADWFDSAENAARTGIAGLAAGSAVLLAFSRAGAVGPAVARPRTAADVGAAVDTAAALRAS